MAPGTSNLRVAKVLNSCAFKRCVLSCSFQIRSAVAGALPSACTLYYAEVGSARLAPLPSPAGPARSQGLALCSLRCLKAPRSCILHLASPNSALRNGTQHRAGATHLVLVSLESLDWDIPGRLSERLIFDVRLPCPKFRQRRRSQRTTPAISDLLGISVIWKDLDGSLCSAGIPVLRTEWFGITS